MEKLNEEREYGKKKEIAKLLSLIKGEIGAEPFYYDIHRMCDRHGLVAPKTDKVIEGLEKMGKNVSRTHFKSTALKTDGKAKDVLKILKKHQ